MNVFIDSLRFNFIYIDTYSFGKTWVYPESIIPYCMFRYITSGRAVFIVDGKEIIVKKNQIIYIPKGCMLACYALEDIFTFTSVRFTSSVHYDGGDFLSEYFAIPTIMYCDKEVEYFENMYYWIRTDSQARMFWVRGYLDILIGSLITKAQKNKVINVDFKESTNELDVLNDQIKKSENNIDSRIQLVIDYMILHPTEKLTTQRMCEMSGISNSRFRTLFKQYFGKTASEYLRNLRITAAARKLLISGDSVSEIGYIVGFADTNYFIRTFKKSFGLTPQKYRKIAKE